MPKTPKTIIEEESLRLIKYITEFEDDDENLQICERFVQLALLLFEERSNVTLSPIGLLAPD